MHATKQNYIWNHRDQNSTISQEKQVNHPPNIYLHRKKKKNFKQNSSGFGYFLHKSMENIVLYDDFWLTKSLVNMCHDNI